MPPAGLIIAAPASQSGKTTVMLALLRALRDRGVAVGSCKIGPDYIDPAFHAAASGRPSFNLDLWAMRGETLGHIIETAGCGTTLLLVEGVMGLFDGAANGVGSSADLAAITGWPVVLVLDVAGQGASAAAVARGFRDHRADLSIAVIVANRIGSPAHRATIERALQPLDIPMLGALPREKAIELPDRHLGLVQAREHRDLEAFLARAAAWISAYVDLDALSALALPSKLAASGDSSSAIAPLGQRIALAQDDAFAFVYPHVIDSWRRQGADLLPFSPLGDEPPDSSADVVYLPGGYPELYAGMLATNERFLEGVRAAAARGAAVYGECGGYMVLGERLVDAAGVTHAMAGLLPLETSFEKPRLHLGYREVRLAADSPLGRAGSVFRGHEFHYANVPRAGTADPLFSVMDATGADLGQMGSRRGRVMGSFVHLIDRR